MKFEAAVLLLAAILASTWADTPANCSYDDVRGAWLFQETARTGDSSEDCDNLGTVVYQLQLDLQFPDVAFDQFGNRGHWTLIYNQGFEVRINQRKYFAFSYYEQNGDNVTSFCDTTFNGWSHDVLVRNWGCYSAQKVQAIQPKSHQLASSNLLEGTFRNDLKMVDAINKAQKSWTAKPNARFEGMSHADKLRMRGGRKSRIYSPPSPAPVTPDLLRRAADLPASFDWRNVSGTNYVTPVRDQGSCGSCYAFSATGMVEARLRVLTNNTLDIVLSPQDVVSCSEYSQGCDGGFPYLIGGKYGQDFGLVEETCDPYFGADGPCNETSNCVRHYTNTYQYIGGFYGGCNEELMREALVKGGPLSVSFEVYSDFDYYTGGIYHHVTVGVGESDFNPFEITNHAVLLVGYGADESTGEKFWSIKNSWGATWGESGYFRIRRGTDECSIESLAVEVLPIP